MSSNANQVDFRSSDTQMLREILKKAGYVTSRMEPLVGPRCEASQSLLLRFKTGILSELRER